MHCQTLRSFMRISPFTLSEKNNVVLKSAVFYKHLRTAVFLDSKVSHEKLSSQNKMPKKQKSTKSTQKQPATPTGPVSKIKDGEYAVAIHAKPGAKQNAVTDVTSEAVGVAIAAPPTDGEANAELVRYLSKVLSLKKSEVILDKGSKSREKVIKVKASISQEEVLERLKNEASQGP
ncbi:UPF0235 protein C15orf40 homolog [Electrophorus electricus]|uniref:Uncharacterized protein n=1 Tax=Electrophorus electricus TaxID=8005 RepID=A0A4W4HA31_ELEEL|nr:UPF0235 protein C15orf40 homolog [Electrophorus electricus]